MKEGTLLQKLDDIMDGKIPPNVTYRESDQSPIKGQEAFKLNYNLSSGLDYNPISPHLSDWVRIIYCGRYDLFLHYLLRLSEDKVKLLLFKKESMYNVSAVFHVVRGALTLCSDDQSVHDFQFALRDVMNVDIVPDGHMKILVKLLCLGVDVNERDVGGRTPLHHICLYDCHNHRRTIIIDRR